MNFEFKMDRDETQKSLTKPEVKSSFAFSRPRRLVYLKNVQNVTKKTALHPGDEIADNVQVFWGGGSESCGFESSGNSLIFKFPRMPKEYFSVTWSLADEELSYLTKDNLVALSTSRISSITNRLIYAQISGKLVHFKVKTDTEFNAPLQDFRGRKVIGFSLDQPGFNFSQANRVWMSLIVTSPRTKSFIIEDLQMLIQKRIKL